MNILIRDVDESTLAVIDRKAKLMDMSRQEYLLNCLNRIAAVDAFREERKEYSTLVKNMGIIMQHNTEQMQNMMQVLEDIQDYIEQKKGGM